MKPAWAFPCCEHCIRRGFPKARKHGNGILVTIHVKPCPYCQTEATPKARTGFPLPDSRFD